MGDGESTSFCARGIRGGDPAGEFGKFALQRQEAKVRATGNQDYTDFFRADRSDVGLCGAAPVDFRAIRPRCDAIVATKGVAAVVPAGSGESYPSADA